MKSDLRSTEELDLEIERVCKNITESYDFFDYIRGFDFGVKDVLKNIDVIRYDEITKDFDGIQFYVAFKKRIEILASIEYAKSLGSESYEMYLSNFTDDEILDDVTSYPVPEEDFYNGIKDGVRRELMDVSIFLEKIFYGDAVKITSDDLKYANDWRAKTTINAIDMSRIAFLNRYCGFMGGMDNKEYNEVIGDVLKESASIETVKKAREIPFGYGWEEGGIGKSTIWAEIDLSAPDEILIEGFKNWIGHAREMHGNVFDKKVSKGKVKSNFKPSLIKRWKVLRVLALL